VKAESSNWSSRLKEKKKLGDRDYHRAAFDTLDCLRKKNFVLTGEKFGGGPFDACIERTRAIMRMVIRADLRNGLHIFKGKMRGELSKPADGVIVERGERSET